MSANNEQLSRKWSNAYPDCEPKAEALRESYGDRWVRFHSLPLSKRYPKDENEYEVMLKRHNTILNELNPNTPIFIFTSGWTDTPSPVPRPEISGNDPDAAYWRTIDESFVESGHKRRSYRQLFVSSRTWESGGLDKLFRAVADDEISGVIIAPEDLKWLYCPYDGGIDIILPSSQERDAIKNRHLDWLSSHKDGL